MHVTEKRIEIRAPVERVFDFFSDFESFPRWMKNIREVRYTGRRFTRWAAEAPLGTEVEWEAETTAFEPDRRIAWRSVRGDVETEGEVIFEETRRGTTLVRVVLGYALPAGRLGDLVARLFGKNPERQLEADLERFAAVVEGRRPRTRRDRDDEKHRDEQSRRERPERSAGRRADVGGPTSRPQYEQFDEHRSGRRLDRRERDYYEPPDERRAFEDEHPRYDDERRGPARRERTRFEEALRAARESQLEGRRRYAAERERRERDDEEARYMEGREYGRRSPHRANDERYERERRAAFDEIDEERRRDDESRRGQHRDEPPRRRRGPESDYDNEDDYGRSQSRRRHALTPRERELERERQEPDRGYTEEAFRRGVEKLMDERPSRRWRRWD